MQAVDLSHITIDQALHPVLAEKNINLCVLRTDKIHPVISGNKWFKLRYYIEDALKNRKTTLVTKGGAWSNHIVATAAACKHYNLRSIGIIRGEKPENLSATLLEAMSYGMELVYISRKDFSENKIAQWLNHPEHYFVDYGGYGNPGADGASTMLEHCNKAEYSHILCTVGSGTMLAGLINAASPQIIVTGISSMKNNHSLEYEVRQLLKNEKIAFNLVHDYHFGGFAKHNTELTTFMNSFYRLTNIPTDIVYTGKLLFAIIDLAQKDYFPPGSNLLAIHSGGLQGNASLSKGTLIF